MIPFKKEFEFVYGEPHAVSPLIRRVVARNPGRFTGPGTGTLVIGHGRVAVVDPGPDDAAHLEALVSALGEERVSHVLVTHQHNDHSPLGRRLADRYGALLCGGRGICTDEHGGAVRAEAADDGRFDPDIELTDGWRAEGPGWTLEAIHTPGHTPQHFCYALKEENALLCGDHLMAWSTSIVSPPDGRMGDYLNSLARIRSMRFETLLPTHGPVIDNPGPFVDAYIAHREAREQAILDQISTGVGSAREIVTALYADVDRALHPAAMHSVWAHLIHLVEQGKVAAIPAPAIDAHYVTALETEAPAARSRRAAPA